MKLFLPIVLFLFSSVSQAAFIPVETHLRSAMVEKVQHALMKEVNSKHYENCIMPYDHGFGVLFRYDGNLYSRDFFFTNKNAELIDLPVDYDAESNTYMIKQTWRINSTYSLIVSFNEDETVREIKMAFSFKDNSDFFVKCE